MEQSLAVESRRVRPEGGDDTRRGLEEDPTGTHDVEVAVRGHVECLQNLVDHLVTLRSDADPHVEVGRTGLHVPDNRAELNGIGADTENEEGLHHGFVRMAANW